MIGQKKNDFRSRLLGMSRRQIKVFWSNNFSKMLARFRASSPDRCPQAAKSPCHPFGTRRGGEKSESFSRRGEQDRPALWNLSNNLLSCNCSGGTIATEIPYRKSLFLGKTTFIVRQKGVSPLLLPASVLQLPRCLVRICNLFLTNHKIANLTVSKNAIAAGKTDCKIEFASQMWATRPHLGSIFVKLLHRKTFRLPAARIL